MAYIYKITNILNDKVYIGQTTKGVSERFSEHKYRAKKIIENSELPKSDKRFNMPISKAMAKYGIDNFTIEVVEKCSAEQLDEKEIYWINFFHSYDNQFGYNATLGGQLTKTNIKIEEAEEIIYQFNNGMSLKKLAKIFQHNPSTILTLLREYDIIDDQDKRIGNRYITPQYQQLIIDLYQECKSLKSVADRTNFGIDMVKSILKKNNVEIQEPANRKKVAQYDLDYNLIQVYDSQSEAGREMSKQYGCSAKGAANHISECCRNKRKTAVGFIWSFY